MADTSGLNWFEKGIAIVAPGFAKERAADRIRLGILTGEGKRSYEAGARSRGTEGWQVRNGSSANTEIMYDHAWLVGRSHDLVRNNPYAKKAVQVITTNTVGNGIMPSIPKDVISKTQEGNIMNAWRLWAETTECDYNGQFNFYGLQMQAWRASVEGGDAFLRKIRLSKVEDGLVPFKLQLLESDYLDSSKDGMAMSDGNYCLAGIEFTQENKRVAYWMFEKHPAEMQPVKASLISVRVPADEIIHIYEVLRPGQQRGIPHGVSAFLRIKDLDQFEDAQLKRQMIAACYSVFVRKNDVNFLEDYEKQMSDPDGKVVPYNPLGEKIAPGIIEYLGPGEDVTFASPPGVDGYDQYTRSVLRSIATGYGITYESLTNDLSEVNFSSGRMGWLEMHRQISQWQQHIVIGMLCKPVWTAFLKSAKMAGFYTGKANIAAKWTPPRRDMIDPLKEAKGLTELVRAGFNSKSEVQRELGNNPEDLNAEIIAEQKDADAAGLMLSTDPKWDAPRVNFGKEAYIAAKTPKAPTAIVKKLKPAKTAESENK